MNNMTKHKERGILSLTEYKIKSQEHMVNQLQKQFDKLTDELNQLSVGNIDQKVGMLNTIRNVLVQEEEKLKQMKKEFENASV